MTQLPISQIRTDGGTQPRAAMDYELVESFADAMEAGAKFPPVDVFYDGTEYWLADGFHRCEAAYGAEKSEITANIIQGTLEDALWFSYAANKTNGLYRSNGDKQRAVQAALKHPKSAGMSDNAIAKHVGVNQQTVANWRKRTGPTSEVRKSTQRVGLDGRTTNTTNIGRTRTLDPAPVIQPTQTAVMEPEPNQQLEARESIHPFGLISACRNALSWSWLVNETLDMTEEEEQVINDLNALLVSIARKNQPLPKAGS